MATEKKLKRLAIAAIKGIMSCGAVRCCSGQAQSSHQLNLLPVHPSSFGLFPLFLMVISGLVGMAAWRFCRKHTDRTADPFTCMYFGSLQNKIKL
jgi:hypothetical protein